MKLDLSEEELKKIDSEFSKADWDDFSKKVNDAYSIYNSFLFLIWAFLFGILASLAANIIHDLLKGYGLIYIILVFALLCLTTERLLSFIIIKMKSKYMNEKIYKYLSKKYMCDFTDEEESDKK